ncbi:MAG: NrdH-redoxin [Methanosarcinaceae archaeon]|jgi:glutaredoxin|nr:NrdH-redoxin [Methanosarcinaceae archaeon]NKQ39530.1 NrdH-redoxin [Methanosarcinales archaeon]
MTENIIYTTKTCPKCEILKKFLSSKNITYKTEDMTQPEALTELRLNGVFTTMAPVMQIDDKFLTCNELFNGNEVNVEILKNIISK